MRNSWKKWSGPVVIVVAAIFMEAILGFQYHYAREQLEKELERSTLMDLITSSLRIQQVLSTAEVAVHNEQTHVQKHLGEQQYLNDIIYNLVANDQDNLDGAFLCFEPNFYPDKGYWYEPYARQIGDTIETLQMGSATHDYTQREYYIDAVKEGISKWTDPYWDAEGARAWVLTYAVPIEQNGKPVGVLGIDLTTSWINDVVNHYHPHPSSFGIVLSEDGELISAPSDTTIVTEHMLKKIIALYNDTTIERKLVGRGRITRFIFHDDECDEYGRVYYAQRKHSPHWHMLLVCYDNEVFGEIDLLRKYMFFLALLGLAVLTLIVWLFIRASRKLQTTQLAQERINSELRVANEIQQSMLPHQEMNVEGLMLNGYLKPAREVGGDLYDYYVRDEKLFFCIGDVSGKGAASAMLMAVTHSLFRSASAHESNPARIVQTINEASVANNEKNMFVTLFVGVLDLPTGKLRYCNAGHDKPIVVESGEWKVECLDCDSNLPVGVFEDTKYSIQETILKSGSTLILYTDGLTEAKNTHREMFGLERVEKRLQVMDDGLRNPKILIDEMTQAVREFVGDAEQSDDLTLLVIHYTPSNFESKLSESLTLTNDIHEVTRLSAFIKTTMEKASVEPTLAGQLRLAIEEAVVNVIDYAYPAGTEGQIDIKVQSDGKTLRVMIRDAGVPFDPTAKEMADTSLSAEDRQIGGLGILLVRELMDTINYERTNGRNVLTLVKRISNL